MKTKLLFLALACLLVGSGPRQPGAALQPDIRIEGTWKVESVLLEGKQILPGNQRWTVVFKAKQVTVLENGQPGMQFRYFLDAAASPCVFDLQDKQEFIRGICLPHGDELMVCLAAEANQPRPRDFAAKSGVVLLTLKRGK